MIVTFKDELAARLRHACRAARISSGAIALSRSGQRFGVCTGTADDRRPFSVQTPTLIGCLAKPLTAMLLTRLIERDAQYTLSSPISSALGPIAPAARDLLAGVTLTHLLNHSHGLQDSFRDEAPRDARGFMDVNELLAELTTHGRLFAPGRTYSYGSAGYWLLGAFIERLTNCPLHDVLVRELLQPLGITCRPQSVNFCPSFGQEVALGADGLLLAAESQLREDRGLQELRERTIAYPGWIATSRAAACGWVSYGDGWYGQNAILRDHSAIIRFSPQKQIALAVTSHSVRAFLIMASVFGEVLPELAHSIPRPRTLTQPEIDASDWTNCLGEFRSPAARIIIRRSRRAHQPLQLSLQPRDADPVIIHLRPAEHGVFFAVPGTRRFSSFQFISFDGGAPLLWNGTHLWQRA